ncbi:MAG: hypothetical protein O6940_04030 [Ignavibacteria bacterium]|nr:hypothetical protein [Ignavibacteria bacterium]
MRRNKFKKIFVVILTLLLTVISCGDNKTQSSDNLNWTTDLGKAIELAKTEHKAVLVNFTGSD